VCTCTGGSGSGATMAPQGEDHLKRHACLGCKRNHVLPEPQRGHRRGTDRPMESVAESLCQASHRRYPPRAPRACHRTERVAAHASTPILFGLLSWRSHSSSVRHEHTRRSPRAPARTRPRAGGCKGGWLAPPLSTERGVSRGPRRSGLSVVTEFRDPQVWPPRIVSPLAMTASSPTLCHVTSLGRLRPIMAGIQCGEYRRPLCPPPRSGRYPRPV
jgi:hypothetical protein